MEASRLKNRWLRPSPNARRLSVSSVVVGLVLLYMTWPKPGPQTIAQPLRVNPNTAPPALLSSLPQLGPARLAAIIAEREKAPFRSLEDLASRVRGIGPATREALRPYLVFEVRPESTSSSE
jgi:DNA uptake protein ComE-like DNA-binding protein